MRIWDSQRDVAFDHELMFAAGIRTFETELLKKTNQIFAFYRTELRHLSNVFNGELYSTGGRQLQVFGDTEQNPFLKDFFKFLPAFL